ncbi:MAG TPA: hypothetical protein VEB86_11260, partial [Chryseosolibacter sp.]|nr:hypothetical protein [Chryseosolibacter sp.]
MKRIFVVLLCLLAFPLAASHIVGGEFEIVHRIGYRYAINLIVYFDEVHGHPDNKIQDKIITARIFRVSDNSI